MFREIRGAEFPKQHFKINNLVGHSSGRHELSSDPKSIRPLAHPTWLGRGFREIRGAEFPKQHFNLRGISLPAGLA
jgi:hypothetical protein